MKIKNNVEKQRMTIRNLLIQIKDADGTQYFSKKFLDKKILLK